MSEHPIEGLMKTAMSSIESLVDVNTIVGEAITTESGIVIIPISKVCFGFAAGGSEFSGETMTGYKKYEKEETVEYKLPFGGGSGGTVSIHPVAFVTISGDTVKINPIEHASVLDKLIDYIPDFMDKLNIDTDKLLKKCNILNEKSKNNMGQKIGNNICKCHDVNSSKKVKINNNNNSNFQNLNDDNFVEEKSKVKSVTTLESNKGPITKRKIEIEYNDNEESDNDDFGLDENIQDD